MKILGINKEFKNEELPSFSKLKKVTYDYFIGKQGVIRNSVDQELIKNSEIPIGGFINTYFGANYDKGGLTTIFKKGILAEKEDEEGVWEGSMKLKINFKDLPKMYDNLTNCISVHCSHCNSIFDLQSVCFAKGVFDHVLKESKYQGVKGYSPEIEYSLSLIFFPDLNIENKICTDDIIWDFFTGTMYWRDHPSEEDFKKKSTPKRNYFLQKKFNF